MNMDTQERAREEKEPSWSDTHASRLFHWFVYMSPVTSSHLLLPIQLQPLSSSSSAIFLLNVASLYYALL
jgi:hypothetical protein